MSGQWQKLAALKAEAVNEKLKDGLHVKIIPGQGEQWVDLYDKIGRVRPLAVGNAHECYLVLDGMYEALKIVGR